MQPDFIEIRHQHKKLAQVLSLIFIQLPHNFFLALALFLIHFMFQVGKPPVSILHTFHSFIASRNISKQKPMYIILYIYVNFNLLFSFYLIILFLKQYGITSFFNVFDNNSIPQDVSYHINFSISSDMLKSPCNSPLYLKT